jgi:ribonuclease HIII
LDGNTIFRNVNYDNYVKVKRVIEKIYNIISKSRQLGVTDVFEISTFDGKIVFTYYHTGILMVQSSPTNTDYPELIEKISRIILSKPEKKYSMIPNEESDSRYEFFIGCDEAGAGESFGSMFLGCTLISREKIENVRNMINNRNIRKLNGNQVNQLFNATKGLFYYEIRQYTPSELESNTKNSLLDRGYIELILKVANGKSSFMLSIDDYGIRPEMGYFIESLKKKGHKVIAKPDADEEYTACKAASLVARQARLNEVETNNNKYYLIDEITNRKILPGSGAASNLMTQKYLQKYRKDNPFSEFPPFVRKKWNNVIEVEINNPKRTDKFFVSCVYCKANLTLIYIRFNRIRNETKFYCPLCGNLISVEKFRNHFSNRLIVLDTSAIIARIVTKDLNSSRYLEGNKFLLPSFVYEELDSKGPNLKKGGQKEISEMKRIKSIGRIDFDEIDTHLLAHGLTNDRKILSVLSNKNADLLTKDGTMTAFGNINYFVIRVEGI